MTEETVATQSEEGLKEENLSQETKPEEKSSAQTQETDTTKVDGGDNKPQVTSPQRSGPKPSDFTRERRRIRELESSIANISKQIQDQSSLLSKIKFPGGGEEEIKFNHDEFVANPEKVLLQREKRLVDTIQGLKNEIGQIREQGTMDGQKRSSQEALEILFPKTSEDDSDDVQERILNDPDRAEEVMQIMKAHGFDRFSEINPKKAAKMTLDELGKKSEPNPKVLKKNLMGGSHTGNPGGGEKKMNTVEKKLAELKKLAEESRLSVDLRNDPKHKALRQKVTREVEVLAEENRE